MVWFKIDSLSGQRTIKVGCFFFCFFFSLAWTNRPSLQEFSFCFGKGLCPSTKWVLVRLCSVPNITEVESEAMAGANLHQRAQQWLWKSVDKELVFKYTNTGKPVPAGSLPPPWKNHHFQHKMRRRSVGHSDPVQPKESYTLPGAVEAPACSKSNHRTELNSRRWVVSPTKLHNKDFSSVTRALPPACMLLSFPRA